MYKSVAEGKELGCGQQTFFLSGSSLYFLERILVRSKLLISGCSLAYLALFSMKKRKYGVKGFLGKSGCFCGLQAGRQKDRRETRAQTSTLVTLVSTHFDFLALVGVFDVVLGIDDQLC